MCHDECLSRCLCVWCMQVCVSLRVCEILAHCHGLIALQGVFVIFFLCFPASFHLGVHTDKHNNNTGNSNTHTHLHMVTHVQEGVFIHEKTGENRVCGVCTHEVRLCARVCTLLIEFVLTMTRRCCSFVRRKISGPIRPKIHRVVPLIYLLLTIHSGTIPKLYNKLSIVHTFLLPHLELVDKHVGTPSHKHTLDNHI